MTDTQIAAAEEQLTVALGHRSNFATVKVAGEHQNRDRHERLVAIEPARDRDPRRRGPHRSPPHPGRPDPHLGRRGRDLPALPRPADVAGGPANMPRTPSRPRPPSSRANTRLPREQKEAIEVPPAVEFHPDLEAGLDRDVAAATAEAQAARAHAGRRAALDERIRALAVTITNVPGEETLRKAEDAVTDARERLDRLPPAADSAALADAREALTASERRRDEERVRWQAASTELARQQERLRRIVEATGKAEAQILERDQAQNDLDELKVLERAYGRDGIPAWIVSQVALPSIQTEATRILSELGTSYRVELRNRTRHLDRRRRRRPRRHRDHQRTASGPMRRSPAASGHGSTWRSGSPSPASSRTAGAARAASS